MSILLGSEIIDEQKTGRIHIKPFIEKHVGPNSLDVTLAPKIVTYVPIKLVETPKGLMVTALKNPADTILDMATENKAYTTEIPEDGIILAPNILYLASTNESAGSDFYVPMYEGRSSLARLGVQSHISAGFGDIFFKSNWTLEITVVHPVKLYAHRRIGQVYFHNVHEEAREKLIKSGKHYSGKYTNQSEPQISKSYLDFDN